MITGLNHLNLSVDSLETSFDFYTQKLNFKPLAKWKRGAYLLAGDLWLCLSLNQNSDCGASRRHRYVASDYTHYAFSVSQTELDYYRQNIEQLNLELWQDNSSEGDSLYILDPDNHQLELHVGNWQTRLAAAKQNPYEEMIFFE